MKGLVKFNPENHPIHVRYMFNGGNSTGYKILYILGVTEKLYGVRAIGKIVNSSAGNISRELKKLTQDGYLILSNSKYSLNLSVVDLQHDVADTQQSVADTQQSVADTQNETIYRINKKNNINNISMSDQKKNTQKSKSKFNLKTSITKEHYQDILNDRLLADGDRDWLLRQTESMADHFGDRQMRDWKATLRNWIRKARYQFGDVPNKKNEFKQPFNKLSMAERHKQNVANGMEALKKFAEMED